MKISDHKHRMPDGNCVRCGKKLTGASGIDVDDRPNPGDLSVCVCCGYLRTFAEDLTLRELTAVELDAFMRDPEMSDLVQRMRRTVRAAGKIGT